MTTSRSRGAGRQVAGDPSTRAAAGESDAPARRGAVALWAAIAALTIVRAALAFVPSTALWSLGLQRFLAPVVGWGLWALLAVGLIPPLARRVTPALDALGAWLARARAAGSALAFLLGAALPALFPDRVRFVGDFLLRQGTVEEGEKPGLLFPQALPIDVLLHYRVPLALFDGGLATPNLAARVLGSLEAGVLAVLALAFARALSLRGAALVATAAAVFFGGTLALYTGYSKAFCELVLLAAATGVFTVSVARATESSDQTRGERALLALGVVLALGAILHRSAFGLLPAVGVAWALWLRARGAGALRRPLALAALVLPAVVMALMVPRILADVRRWDVVHFAPAEVRSGGGPLVAAFADGRPLDLLNLVLMLSPLALPALIAALAAGPRRLMRRELAPLLALALPFVLVGPFIHPVQGLFRDWDDYAVAAITLSLLAAYAIGGLLRADDGRRAPAAAHAWVALAAVLGGAVPSLQWLAHHADERRGLERVYAFVREAPLRGPGERAKTWDYIGIVAFRRDRWAESADAFAHAAETGPSPRILQSWAMAETNRGDLPKAQEIYKRLLAAMPETPLGWLGLAAVSSRRAEAAGDDSTRAAQIAESRRAANALLKLQPGNPDAAQILEFLDRMERGGR